MSEPQQKQQVLEKVCEAAYADIKQLWDNHLSSNREQPPYYGYKILNGPPIYRCPVVFLGYQPGGCMADYYKYLKDQDRWPEQLQYLEGNERLWNRIREILPTRDCLAKCMGMNAIYFRAPSVSEWKKGWGEDERRLRLETTCLNHTRAIIEAVEPKLVVAIGCKIADHIPDIEIQTVLDTGKNSAKQATIFGLPALVIPHLSGVRMTTEEREQIYRHIRRSASCSQIGQP